MRYQTCPKCQGQGTVSKPPYVPVDVHQWSSTTTAFTCDVCHGAKILLVPEPKERFTHLKKDSYTISKETLVKVLKALHDNRVFEHEGSEYNHYDVIEAHGLLEKEINNEEPK